MIDIVVAHYNEHLDWIKQLTHPNINKIYIYSKYETNQSGSGVRHKNIVDNFIDITYFINLNNKVIYKQLPNIGRESETYIRYCIENYNNLPDFTIFLQGNPLDHIGIGDINTLIQDFTDKKYFFSQNFRYYDGTFLGGHLLDWYGPTDISEYNFFTWCRTYIDQELYMHKLFVYYGACFGVSKNHILSRSIEFYKNIWNHDLQKRNPDVAHFLERLWFNVFNCDKDIKLNE